MTHSNNRKTRTQPAHKCNRLRDTGALGKSIPHEDAKTSPCTKILKHQYAKPGQFEASKKKIEQEQE